MVVLSTALGMLYVYIYIYDMRISRVLSRITVRAIIR